jgi:hypothetical protein
LLLKDADTLERGRFSSPNENTGCDIERLGLGIFKDKQLARECAWLAYRLARVTKYANWNGDPGKDLKEALLQSFHALTKKKLLSSTTQKSVDQLIEKLQHS